MVGKIVGIELDVIEYVLGASPVYASSTVAACGLPLTMTEITDSGFATGV